MLETLATTAFECVIFFTFDFHHVSILKFNLDRRLMIASNVIAQRCMASENLITCIARK